MSNQAFDKLWKKCELMNARDSLKTWETARARTDLTIADVEFIDRAIQGAKDWIVRAEAEVRSLHK